MIEREQEDKKLQELHNKVSQLFENLVSTAWEKASDEVLYTMVRVSGMSDTDWDPFDEAIRAFADYKDLIQIAEKEDNKTRLMRIKLLYYCHLVEASAPLDFTYNLLRIKNGQKYHIKPFASLYSRRGSGKVVPPSINQKLKELEAIAVDDDDKELVKMYRSVYYDEVRNSFFHSDYCLTEAQYRWTESGPAKSMKLNELDFLLESAFIFFKSFFYIWDQSRYHLGSAQRYWKLPNCETLELIRNPKGMLIGFNMHFSNGVKATYCRNLDGSVTANNLTFQGDGSINFFIGSFDLLKKQWCVDGRAVTDWNAINSIVGEK